MFDPVGQRSLSAPAIAAVTVLAVVDITAPTELNSRVGGTNGALCLVTQNVAGINEWTLYAFDATSSGSVNSPYVLAASGSGQWIAMAGKYHNNSLSIAAAATAATCLVSDAGIGNTPQALILDHSSSNTPQVNFGTILRFNASSDTTASRAQADIVGQWISPTDATRTGRIVFLAFDATAAREGMRIESDGSTARIGFYGATAVVLPSGTTDLRQALIDLGLYASGGATPLDLNGGAIKNFVAEVVIYTGTSLSISASHRGRLLSTTSTGAVTVTLPASLGAGFPVTVVQKGAGQITFAAGSGTTLNNRQSQTKAAGQYAICTIVSDAADSWILAGDTGT